MLIGLLVSGSKLGLSTEMWIRRAAKSGETLNLDHMYRNFCVENKSGVWTCSVAINTFFFVTLTFLKMDKASESHHEFVLDDPVEEEPRAYNVTWRTLMAILALSVSNTCAAISNTVCYSRLYP